MGTLWSANQGVSSYSEGVIVNIRVLSFAGVISFRGMTVKDIAYGKDSERSPKG